METIFEFFLPLVLHGLLIFDVDSTQQMPLLKEVWAVRALVPFAYFISRSICFLPSAAYCNSITNYMKIYTCRAYGASCCMRCDKTAPFMPCTCGNRFHGWARLVGSVWIIYDSLLRIFHFDKTTAASACFLEEPYVCTACACICVITPARILL